MPKRVYREFNLDGGRCPHPGCQRWARFRYLEREAGEPGWHPPQEEWHTSEAFCTMAHWRQAHPKPPSTYVPKFPHPGVGAQHPRSKLTDEQVRQILRRIRDGESDTGIARAFGVTRQAIGYIRRGRSWRHTKEWTL